MHSLFLLADIACCALLLFLEALLKSWLLMLLTRWARSPCSSVGERVYHALDCG